MACLLLVIPGLQVAGAAVAFATMGGAIMLHLFTALGVDPYNDGGTLFKEACTNLVFAAIILFLRRDEILPLLRRLRDRSALRAADLSRLILELCVDRHAPGLHQPVGLAGHPDHRDQLAQHRGGHAPCRARPR